MILRWNYLIFLWFYITCSDSKKLFLSFRKYDPGYSSYIPDPNLDFLPIPDPGSGSQKASDPRSGSAKLVALFLGIQNRCIGNCLKLRATWIQGPRFYFLSWYFFWSQWTSQFGVNSYSHRNDNASSGHLFGWDESGGGGGVLLLVLAHTRGQTEPHQVQLPTK
jgi:hypothetical protein